MSQNSLPLVLIVDDERFNLDLLQRFLHGYFHVISVTNGMDALDILAQAPFDLVLLDIMMPQMNGLEVLQRIRSKAATADIPVILISALTDTQQIVRGLEAGANDYITKPIDPDVTFARVRTQITLKRLQDERKQTIAELQTAQEMKDRMLKIASHDLKGPISNLRMIAYLLHQCQEAIPDGQSLLETMEMTLDGMSAIIKDFLDSAALQSGVLDLRVGRVCLHDLINLLVTEHQGYALRKNISLQTFDTGVEILADVARFRQVMDNLISNAIKYSPPDTTVRIGVECSHTHARIGIADEGPGIPPDEVNRLFTQFGKLSTRPTAGESSTGLGLWIVKHLATLQGGQVGVECPPDGGSIFWVTMPLAETIRQDSG